MTFVTDRHRFSQFYECRYHLQASSEKESTNTGFGKPKNTVPETWDKVFREAEQLLDEALKLFKQCSSKHNEAGECLLLLAQLKVDKNYVFDALKFFQQKGHLANFAAVLECYEVIKYFIFVICILL